MKHRRILILGLVIPAVLLALAGAATYAGFRMAVERVPESTFTREGIRKILARESVVLYSDGKTRVGTFFEGAHRDYLPYDSIPRMLVESLVSAEDRNFWDHSGWDFRAFAHAMVDNVRSGGRWRGGSTLTQQTAKNLFGRTGPLRGKVDELFNAYRLERSFTKEEILEFYLNQFYVIGNGHGVSIAARYFFDKEPRQLNLVECAFIAGSVKGPNQYNPFIQGTPERREAALERGRTRTAYVLGQLRRHGKISEETYRAALANPPRFKRGNFRFSLSTNMMKVKRQLDEPAMQEILARFGVEDYTAAGLQIYTTLDAEIQKAAEHAVYSNLARLDLVLRGYVPPEDTSASRLSHFEPGSFATGRVMEVTRENGVPVALRVRFGGIEGVVPQASLETFFRTWNWHESGRPERPAPRAMADFAARHFRVGSMVYCGVPYRAPHDRNPGPPVDSLLEIAQSPRLQGAALVMQEGRILANVGGFGNTGYDRVNQARRQFGSSFKPFVYAAALELGWHPLDPIPNHRQAFQLGSLIYFPKPDHRPEDTVSLAWAGRRSENIASVWLLYHLFDKTDFAGFWEQCRRLGIDPDNFPSQEAFEAFVREKLGVSLDPAHLREIRYAKAVSDLAIDLTFDGRLRETAVLRGLPYGLGFAYERGLFDPDSIDAEAEVRIGLLSRNYLDYAAKAAAWRRGDLVDTPWVAARNERDGRLGLFAGMPGRGWQPVTLVEAMTADPSQLFIEGALSLETLRALEERLRPGDPPGPRYTRENLYASKDFRAQAALRYVTDFSRKLDVTSRLARVLSFPLGVNSITLGEAVNAYQAFQGGARYRTRLDKPQLYIEKIVSASGRVIFEDYVERDEVLSERARALLQSILASVIQGGTGQRIGRELRIRRPDGSRVSVPAYGKTGTTNDYRNAAFLGFIAAPKGQDKGFDPAAGYAIGVYTGFDDNQPMEQPGFRGTGASASIPAWLEIAQGIAGIHDFASRLPPRDTLSDETAGPPLFQQDRYTLHKVSRRTGLPPTRPEAPGYTEDISDELGPAETIQPVGDFAPLWIRED